LQSLSQSHSVYRFGTFEANPGSGELLKQGVRVRLQDKPFQVLIVLLQAQGQVVGREEIRSRLWPSGTFVEFDESLNAAVKKLRLALADSAEQPRFIETVPKLGYRFIAPITAPPESIPSAGRAILGSRGLEETPGVIEASDLPRRELSSASKVSAHPSKPFQIIAACCVVLAAAVFTIPYYAGNSASPGQIRSIAVLPLENLSGDAQQQYFADGMTDELITNLAKISSLSVISRTSSAQYRGAKKSLPVIGRELNVDGVIEGTVARSGDKVHVTVQLVDARNDRHIWAEDYEYEADNLLQLQIEIASAVAEQIRVKLTPAEKRHLAESKPVNSEAHEAYLKGLYFWNERTAEGLKTSIAYFEEAIRKDPSYALAYSGLADAYDVSTDYDLLSPRDSYSKAKAAAVKALDLDPNLAQAHATLADMKAAYEWDWMGAETEFKRALELNPGYATAHHWYAQFLTAKGRHPEALAEIHRAMELDPLSPSINAFAGSALYMARKYDDSAELLTKMIGKEAGYAPAHYFLGFTREKQGRLVEAIQEFKEAVDLSGGDPSYVAALGYAYALSGKQRQALAISRELQKRGATEYVSSYDVALVYVGLDHRREALNWLNRAYEEDDPNMNFLRVEPTFDGIRSEKRFQDLLQRIGGSR